VCAQALQLLPLLLLLHRVLLQGAAGLRRRDVRVLSQRHVAQQGVGDPAAQLLHWLPRYLPLPLEELHRHHCPLPPLELVPLFPPLLLRPLCWGLPQEG
jgi:hypothetical protein